MLSKQAKYAIKALILLGKNLNVKGLSATEIAESEMIPKKTLEKILNDLRNAGYVYSRKGVTGGYSLLLTPEKITLDKILRLIDGPIARISCASIFHYRRCEECKDEASCSIRDLFITMRDNDVKLLAGTSIGDLIAKEHAFRQLFAADGGL